MTASPLAQTPNDMFNAPIAEADPEIAEILDAELSRQQNGLEMIASENFVPRAVLQAQGSVLTNKYAEGYPGRRYYGGCEQVDKIETIARERAKSLFGAEYANVQPHSGAQANAAVYQALVKPGDMVLGLALDHGGHLTHGMKINFSGRFYHAEAYGVNPETFRIDPEIIRQRALETHPAMIIGGWSAYPRIEDFKAMKEIADEVGAKFWVDMAHFAGLVAAGLHPSPVPYADAVLIGWPETDASDVITPDAAQLDDIDEQMRVMEQHIAKFSAMERDHDIVGMTDTLIRVTERVAGIRSIYQPDFPLPTFAEIRRVVQDEWDEDMDKIDPDNASPTADSIEQETADADKEQQAEKQAEQQADGAQKSGASA